MKTPDFWYNNNPLSITLAPLAKLYASVGRKLRYRAKPHSTKIPVICVGNIVSGGSGKTPTAIALLQLIQDKKIALSPYFLTRGYGGQIKGPERVDDIHDPAMWGDEALLLARYAPTIVSRNRYKGAVLAQELGSDLVILDDGMQHYSLHKNITFCVIDGAMGFGNSHVVPQGPLRQPLKDGYALSDAFILIGDDKRNVTKTLPHDLPIFNATLSVKENPALSKDTAYIAFCGIGYPKKFADTLNSSGLKIIDFKAFGDHHDYTQKNLDDLVTLAQSHNARLITTEKDFARLPAFDQKSLIDTLSVEIIFSDPAALIHFIQNKITR